MKLAIFDFDGTLFPKDTLPFLLSRWRYLRCSGLTVFKTYLACIPFYFQYKFGLFTTLSREELKLKAVRIFNPVFDGISQKEMQDYFSVCCQEIKGLLNPTVLKEVQKAREEGFHTIILSGSYQDFLQKIGDLIGFDTVIGSEMYYRDGIFDSKVELDIIIGEMKMKKIMERFGQEQVNWEASRAYADGYSDLDLLLAVGQPIVVNPDSKLKPIAIEKGWKVL